MTELQHHESLPQHSQSRAALPRTVIGKWASGLLLVLVALLTWAVVGVNSGLLERGSLLSLVVGDSMLVAGTATVVTALLARIRSHDRSWVITVGMIVPALIVIPTIGFYLAGP